MSGYAELQVTSNYSFLRGASHVEELFVAAKALGMSSLAITDHNTLAGIARAHARAAEVGIRLVVGCRLDLRDGLPVLVYPTDRAAYGRLCRLLTLGKGRTGKVGCDLAWADLVEQGVRRQGKPIHWRHQIPAAAGSDSPVILLAPLL